MSGWFTRQYTQLPSVEVRETIRVVHDTIRDSIPVPVDRPVHIIRYDSIPYYTNDTTVQNDTVYVPIPIERKEYRTNDYYAVVEGFKPALTYIETYNKTVYNDRVEIRKTKPRWGIGVQAGYGVTVNGKFSPYVGIGVQYNILTF